MFAITEATAFTTKGKVTYWLHQPPTPPYAAQPALLLTFSSTRQASFQEDPYDLPARRFAAAGHAVVSFDLPNHGEQINRFGQGIAGLCAAFSAGEDPFVQFVTQGRAVIDACLRQGIGTGGVFACGVSRAGYCALRLAAADHRIRAVAGLAPVTDWRVLSEFAGVRSQPAVAALTLTHWAEHLADRAVFLAIGNHDTRVGADSCVRFALRLLELEEQATAGTSALQLHVVDAAGHSLDACWRTAGVEFLLGQVDRY